MRDANEADWDVVVIGAGPVGENVAATTAAAGLATVVVESELVGGECSYWACMPSKALLRSGAALRAARAVAGSREAVTGALDAAAVLERRTSFTSGWQDDGQVEWLSGAGIALRRGTGRLSGQRQVSVTGSDGRTDVLNARVAVVLCTGSTPTVPPLDGLDGVSAWGSREATSAAEVPTSLVVVGGGVVGVEMATAWRSLGSEVTLLARDRVLAGFEPFAGDRVAEGLRALGVEVRTGADVHAVRQDGDEVVVTVGGGDEVRAQRLLLATGRAPRTHDLGLETVDVDPDTLLTDDSGRVPGPAADWLLAAGDVSGRAPLTHQGKYQARVVGATVVALGAGQQVDTTPWSPTVSTADGVAVPQVVFAEPEIASVGRTLAQAREQGVDAVAIDQDLGAVAGASLHADGYQGAARFVVDRARGVLVGATFVGPDVAELLHAATIAVVGEVPMSRLAHAVPAYPTISEVWLRFHESYRDGAAHEGP